MKKIPKTPKRAKFNAQKRSSKVDDLRFNAPAARFKSTVFWPFPKPKTPEHWWWLAIWAVILVTYAYIVLFSILLAP